MRSPFVVRVSPFTASLSDFSWVKAMQSSVRLRHMLSAFLRNRRSIPATEGTVCEPPGVPIAAKISASDAVASNALNTPGSIKGLDLANAECNSGCISAVSVPLTVLGETLPLRPNFGEEEMVVIVVVAVGGRSLKTFEMAASEVGGSFPVSSSFRILCLRSSTSSHIVEGAVVETVDAVPSAWCI